MGNPYGDLPHSEPTRLTDSAEEYAAPSEAAQQLALAIHDSFIRTIDFELSMNRIAMMFDAFARQAVAAAVAERDAEILSLLEANRLHLYARYTPTGQAWAKGVEIAIKAIKEHFKQ